MFFPHAKSPEKLQAFALVHAREESETSITHYGRDISMALEQDPGFLLLCNA